MDKKGVSVEIKLQSNLTTASDDSFFQVDKVSVTLNDFAYTIQQSEHGILATLLYPFIKPIIRVQLQHLLEREIQCHFDSLDGYGRDLKARIRAAKGLGPEAWVQAILKGGTRQRSRGGQYSVNIGEDLLRGFHGPLGEGVIRGERRAEANEGWKSDIFDPQR